MALARLVEEFATELVRASDVPEILQRLCDRSTEALAEGCTGVMLFDPDGTLQLAAESTPTLGRLRDAQLRHGQGPSVEAARTGAPVQEGNLRDAVGRWPDFAPRALELGIHAAYCFPLKVDDRCLGSFDVFAEEPHALDPVQLAVAGILATFATCYLVNTLALRDAEQLAAQLQHALTSRVVIEQAKGRLAERLDVDEATAFGLLRRHARGHSRKLHDVAREVIAGELDLQLEPQR